jgi:glycine betaine transporter
MFAFTQTAFSNENQLILILAGLLLLYSTGMGSGLLLRAVQEPTYYLIRLLKLQIRLPLYNNTFFHWDLHHGQCTVYLV